MKNVIQYFFVCVAVTSLTIFNVGCTREFKTIVIKPDSKRFVNWKSGNGHNNSTCVIGSCLATMGTNCDPELTEDDSTIVGYSHRYNAGTQPCACWEYVDCAYRGHVGFNVSQLKQVGLGAATLKWDPITEISAGETATNSGNCIAKIYRATEPWEKEKTTAGVEISSWDTGAGINPPTGINVSDTVRSWLNGTHPNYGFFFVGPNENVHEKNNNRCLTRMKNLRLEVLISVDK